MHAPPRVRSRGPPGQDLFFAAWGPRALWLDQACPHGRDGAAWDPPSAEASKAHGVDGGLVAALLVWYCEWGPTSDLPRNESGASHAHGSEAAAVSPDRSLASHRRQGAGSRLIDAGKLNMGGISR